MENQYLQLINEMPQGILNWFQFKEKASVLYITGIFPSILDLLISRKLNVISVTIGESADPDFAARFGNYFDYIVCIKSIETQKNPAGILSAWKQLIKASGKLLLATDNRLGLKNFCGDKDDYTGRVFDGIENYKNVSPKMLENIKGRCYSRAEVMSFLKYSGWTFSKSYSVLPNLQCPQLIYSEDYMPEEILSNRYFPKYSSPETVFLEEEYIYKELIADGVFHQFANSYLFECSLSDFDSDVQAVTVSMDRGHAGSLATVIKKDRTVEKTVLFPEGLKRIYSLHDNSKRLIDKGIKVVEGKIAGNKYVMPYIKADTANKYLQNLLDTKQVDMFISEMDKFINAILSSSDKTADDPDLGPIFEYGYMDLVPLNCFHINDDFVFFDQEFAEEDYPVNVMILRTICMIYETDSKREQILPASFFFDRYKLNIPGLGKLYELSGKFTEGIRNQSELADYTRKVARNDSVLKRNRERMNYAEEDYEYLLYNPLKDANGKKLYLFGSGRYAEKFIAMYKRDYDICGLLDNDPEKWGTSLEGLPVLNPDILYEQKAGGYKVIICIKNYADVLAQLKNMGVPNISVYQAQKVYPGRQACEIFSMYRDSGKPKKYHIGYLAGVFDLYHLGHLNMFRRAKEQCDYLIVGVVTDEGVRVFKGTEPFIPFDERIEMVRSCRFVDEAVEIPFIFRTTKEAFEKYHFDVQFSGSDYENNPEWLETKKWLEERGADLVFFPYTQQTSSTKIKALIEKGLA